MSSRRIGLWAGGILLGIVAIVVLVRIGVGVYLGTSSGRATVARELESMIGLPVEVAEVDLGSRTSSVKFRVLDPALAGQPDAEVLSVESATADVSFTDVLTGRANPKTVRLRGVSLNLRISADGKLLTTIPTVTDGGQTGSAVPTIALESGRVRIRQEGKPEFALEGIDLKLTPDAGRLVLSGTIDDPRWGKWQAAGEIDRTAQTGWFELNAADAPLVAETLRTIPYAPGSIWDHVQPNGRGGAKVRFDYAPDGGLKYAVEIQPHGTLLTLPDAEVTLADLTGTIRVRGTQVELADCRANVAGGSVQASGRADFGPEPTVVTVKVSAKGLDVNAVPARWGVPKDFGGRLTGAAAIVLRIADNGAIDPTGSTGNGTIENATIRGVPAEVELNLRPEGDGLKLQPSSPQPQSLAPSGLHDPAIPVLLALVQSPPKVEVPPPTVPPKLGGGTNLDVAVTFREVDVGELLAKLDVKVPVKLSGKVMAKLALSVPVVKAGAVASYHFQGTVASPALTVEGLTIREAFAQIDFRDGLLTLTELRGQVSQPNDPGAPPGTFTAKASAQIDPPGDIRAAIAFDRIAPGEVLKSVPGWTVDVRGVASGKVEFSAPYNAIDNPATWVAKGHVSSDELVVADRTVTNVKFAADVDKGTATIRDAAATIAGIPVTAQGTIGLADKFPFAAELHTQPTSVTDLRKLAPDLGLEAVEGVLEVDAKVSGTLSPVSFRAGGTIRASKLTLASTPANRVEIRWEADEDRLRVPSFTADLFGGKVNGSGEYPFDPKMTGKFTVTFETLDTAAASALVPDFPVKLTGRVTGKVTALIAPAKANESRIGDLDLSLRSDRLTVQGIPADSLEGTATIKGGVLHFALKGKTLGGDFDVKGSYPGTAKGQQPQGERGSVRVRNIDLSRLAPELHMPALAPLRGRASLTFEFEPDLSAGSGRIEIIGLGWGSTLTSQELRGVLLLDDGVLAMRELSGPFARGLLEARGRIVLREPMRNFFALHLSRVNARELLAPFPDLAASVDGELSAVIRGTYHREFRLDGTVSLHRGALGGIAVDDLRVPFRLTSGRGGFTELAIREASTRAGSGRLQAEATLLWGSTLHVDARIRFAGVPLATVVPSLGTSALIGNGRITGRFDLTGSNVRSVNDLNGTLIASLQGATPAQIPLLQQAVPYLNPFGLVKPFDTGDIRASLSRGFFRVQRLALVSPSAQVFAEGTVTLEGRVELHVVAHTGQIGPDVQTLRRLGLRLPVFGPIPISLISDVSAFLSNRTIRLEITGTTSSPQVRVNARALLTEQAVRFFLDRYVLPAEAADVFGGGTSGWRD